ncbi:MAG: HPt domain-containing protein [Solidesulfovibrio magneticus str. Maddingley MBC34]|uniref:HPt domain-containing protein n=1 Tax=Solidesulfovibrio magneticus str. Maddingley MBC34 TaxID=1206767 RepID=K6HCN1_9BACT|nr:MAG: HPt domain-containing protein [Solidesulfovibrio magneticus str. Maddingley MBC34]
MNATSITLPATVRVSQALKPIYPQFLEIQRRHLAGIAPALAVGDTAEARRLAHSVKGAAGSYELPAAAALAAAAEIAIIDGRQEEALALAVTLGNYLAALTVVFIEPHARPTPLVGQPKTS